jgi:nitrite reductase/ring-hydroxylating ferredoxin subunit
MASRVATPTIEPHHPVSAADLRHVFETAVCEIHQSRFGAKSGMLYRAPIVPRARVLGISQENAEKRALTDAARALAQLWKV